MLQTDYKKMLIQVLEQQRKEFNKMIDDAIRAITQPSNHLSEKSTLPQIPKNDNINQQVVSLSSSKDIEYSGMTLLVAAKQYLESVGSPKSTRQLATALLEKGFQTNSKDFINTASATLSKAKDIVKMNSGLWGLKEWKEQENLHRKPENLFHFSPSR